MEYKESTVRKISHVCYVVGIWVSLALAVIAAFCIAKAAAHSHNSPEEYCTSYLYGDKQSIPEITYNELEAAVKSNEGNIPIDFYYTTNNVIKNTKESRGVSLIYDQSTNTYGVSIEDFAWEAYCNGVTFKDSDEMAKYFTSLLNGKDPVSAYQVIYDFNNNNGFSEVYNRNLSDDIIFEIVLHFFVIAVMGSLFYALIHEAVGGDGHLIPMIVAFIPCIAITGIYSLITKRLDKKAEQKSKEEKFEDNYTAESVSQDNSDDTTWYHKIIRAFSVDCGSSVRSLIESMKRLNSYYEDVSEDSSHSFYNIYCKELYNTLTSIREQFQRGTISMKEEIVAIEKTCSLYHDIFVSLFEHIKERDRMSSDNYEISNEAMRKYAQSMGHLDSDKISSKILPKTLDRIQYPWYNKCVVRET